MSEDKKEYLISEEIADAFDDCIAQTECRDECIKSFFGYRRAAYFSKRATKSKAKGWKMFFAVYPEAKTANYSLSYNTEKSIVVDVSLDKDSNKD